MKPGASAPASPTIGTFEAAIRLVLKEEGGYTAGAKDDPGGETNYGISRRSYPTLDILNLTEDEAIGIYRRDYWGPIHGDELPPKLAVSVLDTAVNCGTGMAAFMLQQALGFKKADVDGEIGPKTVAAAWQADSRSTLLKFTTLRILHYAALANWKTWGPVWTGRALRTYTAALLWGA